MRDKFTVYSLQFTVLLLLFLYPIPYSLTLVFATHTPSSSAGVSIGEHFGFGDIKSLGEGTSRLVMPFFSLAAVVVILYFLLGAFRYLRAGGNKEEVEGARQMITHAIIGFILLMFAFFILQFLLSALFKTPGFDTFRIIGP